MKRLHEVTQYAADVVYGKIIACKWEKLTCKRHLNDLERQGTAEFPFVFDETRADRIFQWFRICRHVRGPFSGQPIELDSFSKFDLGSVFGWVHKDTGKRRFKTAYIRVARGNFKSTLMSGVANYGMCGDALYPPGQPGLAKYEAMPEVVCGAVDKEQAKRVWEDARAMAWASPDILKRLDVKKTAISHKTRGGSMKKLSKDTKNKDSGAPCIIIIDEYHAHPTSLVKDVTSSGKGKRSQCLEFIITTAGEDSENSPCKKEDDIGKRILLGEIPNESYYIAIREIDDEEDPHDERCWIKANPVFQTWNAYSEELFNTIKDEHELAFGSGDNSKVRQWMIKRVNRWQADAENKYFSGCMDKWKNLAVSKSKFLELTKNAEGWEGIDLAKTTDLTADAFVTRLADGRIAVSAHGYMPIERAQQHEHSDRVPYKKWAQDGWCTLTDGPVTDYRFIKTNLHDREFDNGWKYKQICYDSFNASHFIQDLVADRYEIEQMVEVRQGFKTLSEPTKKFREYVLQGKLVHDGNPLLTWCLGNAVERNDENGNIALSKKNKDDSQRIDLAAAAINAMVGLLANDGSDSSVYDDRPAGEKIFSV